MKRKYSYSEQKSYRHKKRWVKLSVILFLLLYVSFSSMFFSMRVLQNETMGSNLMPGERFVFSSYRLHSIIPALDFERGNLPFNRGSVVLVDMSGRKSPGPIVLFFDGILRFFTVQRLSITEHREQVFVKRVIGLPGDEIIMNNFVVRVRVSGSAHSLTEFEVTYADYTPDIPQIPALWDSSLPFSGNMDAIVLGENECFVLSDDRSNTNDSRTWGPVPVKSVIGKAVFRYWPLSRMGRP
ncbi:MAG: signal peptidase I [Treponema sp.]|nr:signal peptidase I [Treponema sp.]